MGIRERFQEAREDVGEYRKNLYEGFYRSKPVRYVRCFAGNVYSSACVFLVLQKDETDSTRERIKRYTERLKHFEKGSAMLEDAIMEIESAVDFNSQKEGEKGLMNAAKYVVDWNDEKRVVAYNLRQEKKGRLEEEQRETIEIEAREDAIVYEGDNPLVVLDEPSRKKLSIRDRWGIHKKRVRLRRNGKK